MISDADFEKLLEGPPDTKETNPKDAIGTTKLDFGLVPDTAVAAMAVGFTEGDAKYGGHNYRVAGVRASIYHAALRRHVAKWWNGEDTDPTTGVPHLWNALCCLAVLVDADECKKLTDDRPPRAPVADMIDGGAGYVQRLRELFPNGPRRYTHVEDDPE